MPDHETCTKLEVNQAVTNERLGALVEYIQTEFKQIDKKINYLIISVVGLSLVVLGGDEGAKIIKTLFL